MEREKMIGAGGGPENTTGQGGDTNSTEVHEPVKTRHAYSRPEDLKKIDEILTPSGQTPATAPSAVDAGVAEALNKVAEALTKVQNPVLTSLSEEETKVKKEVEARRVEDARLEAETRRLEAESRRRAAEAEERARIAEAESRRRAAEAEERARITKAEAEARAARAGTAPTPGTSEKKIGDAEIAELDTEEKAEKWVEAKVRLQEKTSSGEVIALDTIKDLEKEIGKIPVDSKEFKDKMVVRVRARLRYHNAAYLSQNKLNELSEEFNRIDKKHHKEIYNTLGVKEALVKLIENRGEFYRLSDEAADAKRDTIKLNLTGRGLSTEDAELAMELAEKTAHIFGDSAYYDGIRDKSGAFIGEKDFLITKKVLNEKTGIEEDRVYLNQKAMADYLVDHWDEINFDIGTDLSKRSLGGRGASNMRRIFYLPVWLQKEKKGTVEDLRKYAYLWVTSATRSQGRKDLIDLMDHIDDDRVELLGWAKGVSTAYDKKGTLYEKGSGSVLNMPFLDPNKVEFASDAEVTKAISEVMKNYLSSTDSYSHLEWESLKDKDVKPDQQRAMMHLLVGELKFINNTIEKRKYPFTAGWLNWSQKKISQTITWAAESLNLDLDEAHDIERRVNLNRGLATAQTAAPYLGEALGAFGRGLLREIFKK